MMRYAMLVAGGLTLAACGGGGDRPATGEGAAGQAALPVEVQTALAVASGIRAAPDRTDSILAANGLTPAGFDSLMYRIAADSALRAAFNAGRR